MQPGKGGFQRASVRNGSGKGRKGKEMQEKKRNPAAKKPKYCLGKGILVEI